MFYELYFSINTNLVSEEILRERVEKQGFRSQH